MNFDPNPLFYEMVALYNDHRGKEDKVIICNEGGSRSSKTWDFFHFLVFYCDHNRNKHNEIYILRDTLVNCRDFTLKEFIKCLQIIGVFDSNLLKTSPKPYYDLFGNDIYFRGLDDEMNTEGYPSDIVFVNEALETRKRSSAGILMRCRKLVVMDWNPKYTDHWCFELEGQPNVHFTHSTYKNNKHLEQSIIKTIEGYNPWHPEDLHLPIEKRRAHPVNVPNKTADLVRHQVYAMGVRCSPQGAVFPDVTWIDAFPKDYEREFFGIDFGFTNDPTAVCRVAIKGRDLFFQNMFYTPTDNVLKLIDPLRKIIGDKTAWADLADRGMISDLQVAGLNVYAAKKFPGCIAYRIDIIKRYNIHIVRDSFFRKEQENYFYREVNGIKLNEPDPQSTHCHLWDAAGYACQHELR